MADVFGDESGNGGENGIRSAIFISEEAFTSQNLRGLANKVLQAAEEAGVTVGCIGLDAPLEDGKFVFPLSLAVKSTDSQAFLDAVNGNVSDKKVAEHIGSDGKLHTPRNLGAQAAANAAYDSELMEVSRKLVATGLVTMRELKPIVVTEFYPKAERHALGVHVGACR